MNVDRCIATQQQHDYLKPSERVSLHDPRVGGTSLAGTQTGDDRAPNHAGQPFKRDYSVLNVFASLQSSQNSISLWSHSGLRRKHYKRTLDEFNANKDVLTVVVPVVAAVVDAVVASVGTAVVD